MIRGTLITLRPARESDRRAVYEWLAESDITSAMLGPPTYPDSNVPTWDEFQNDYEMFFFDGSRPELGRCFIIEANGEPVGHLSYSEVNPKCRRAELDIWMRSEAECGHGSGTDALLALMDYLRESLGLREFIMRPSRRNARAMRSYAKAGFVALPLTNDEQVALYGPGDYGDTVVMQKIVN